MLAHTLSDIVQDANVRFARTSRSLAQVDRTSSPARTVARGSPTTRRIRPPTTCRGSYASRPSRGQLPDRRPPSPGGFPRAHSHTVVASLTAEAGHDKTMHTTEEWHAQRHSDSRSFSNGRQLFQHLASGCGYRAAAGKILWKLQPFACPPSQQLVSGCNASTVWRQQCLPALRAGPLVDGSCRSVKYCSEPASNCATSSTLTDIPAAQPTMQHRRWLWAISEPVLSPANAANARVFSFVLLCELPRCMRDSLPTLAANIITLLTACEGKHAQIS